MKKTSQNTKETMKEIQRFLSLLVSRLWHKVDRLFKKWLHAARRKTA